MKLFSIKIILIFLLVFFDTAYANDVSAQYSVSTSGINIGKFSWVLKIKENKYQTEIYLKNSGIFSALYKFEGKYMSKGIVENNKFKTKEYKQYWKTKKKVKIVEMEFDGYLTNLVQNPKEKELSRVNLYELFEHFDPITSFINILNGEDQSNTVDGRRVYSMKKIDLKDTKKIKIEIQNYKNIWADHKRNDLKTIEFILGEDKFLPENINIYFKDRIFKLKKY